MTEEEVREIQCLRGTLLTGSCWYEDGRDHVKRNVDDL